METEETLEDRRSLQLGPSEADLRGFFDAAPDALVLIDRRGRILFINSQTERLFGYPREELVGQSMEVLVPDRFRAVHPGHRAAFFSDPKVRGMGTGLDLWGLCKDGSERPIEISLSPIETESGLVVLSAIRDVTDRHRAQKALTIAKERAEAASRELEAFSYSVAHDLRAPLRSIDGFSLALLEDYADRLDETGRDYLERVRGGAQRMAQLIDSLLLLARLTQSKLEKSEVNLSALVRASLRRLEESAPGRQVEIRIAENLRDRGDARLLSVLFDNLLGNAWKFTSRTENARIEFGREELDGRSHYFIRDNGAGFDMSYANKLFGVFQRLHSTNQFEGIGIGLATVQRIVHRHGGSIHARGEVGRGAVFYFTLGENEESS